MDFLQGRTLIYKTNESIQADVALKKKSLILYYFTSVACDACRVFDVKLKEVYYEANFRKIELAIIIVSVDDTKDDFQTNIQRNYHDWYAIKFEEELSKVLTYNYGVTHVPTLIVVRKNGTIVTREGQQEVDAIGINVLVTWTE